MMKIKQVAERLEVSEFTVDRLASRADFPRAIRYSPKGHRHWREEDIERWLEKQLERQPSSASVPA